MTSSVIEELYRDRKLDSIIRNMTSWNNEYELAKSELFFILLNKPDKLMQCKDKEEQYRYISKIIKFQIHSSSSNFHKTWRNKGQGKRWTTSELHPNFDKMDDKDENEVELENKIDVILDRIDEVLNKDITWYDASLFRLYYLPYKDKHCDKKVYTLRDIENMHTCGEYKIDHVAIFHRVKKTFEDILLTLKLEGLLVEDDIKNIRTLKLFKKI